MPNKMLIDTSHPEETRVVVVRGNRIEEFDFESQDKKQLKGNIYLARVTRVEPSLQAAFVEYGGNRHGFLAFSEIHPDYYQIPVADRQALLKAEAEDAASEDDDDDNEERGGRNRRRRGSRNRGRGQDRKASETNGDDESAETPAVAEDETTAAAETAEDQSGSADGDDAENGDGRTMAHAVDADVVSEDVSRHADDEHHDDGEDADDAPSGKRGGGNGDEDEVVSVGAEDALEEIRERRRPMRRQYKIQEVIKRRQILLVQVVKEERGNKGAALTTYLSLAGRYSVLMPNTARGGGISRKITNATDRKRLKDVVKDLDVPQGMGVILRTAGESRTKAEIKRDYEYLMRMWDNVRTLTLQSSAPALVYEEGSLIKRSVRDLYNKDIDEILVAGEEGYREAKDFMRMLMPSHAKVVQPYRDTTPIFARNGIEAQLDRMVQPQVTLKSGGYIIINQTEALVAIDVNSGRSTKEHSIEDTALQTNLEAAEEVARQLRLRDLAGLIVIDFIDMEENRNNRAVEKRVKDCLKNDRARIQVGRISHFGLLEMSRQRIRASVLESTMQTCPHCGGAGHVRSESSVGLLVIRAIEEFLLKDSRHHITVRTPASTALYVLNHKRANLTDLENRFGLTITVEADETVRSQHYAIFKGAASERPITAIPATLPVYPEEPEDEIDIEVEEDEEVEVVEAAAPQQQPQRRAEEDGDGQRKRKRRRRRRGGRDRERPEGTDAAVAAPAEDAEDDTGEDADDAPQDTQIVADGSKKRRRGKRGGKRNRREDGDEASGEDAVDADATAADVIEAVAVESIATVDDAAMAAVEETGAPSEPAEAVEIAAEPKKKPARRSTKKAKAVEPEVVEAAADLDVAQPEVADPAPAKPKRAPRRKAAAAPAETETETVAVEVAEEIAPEAPAAEEAPAPAAPKLVSSKPVVTSSAPDTEDDTKPRKAGWWQRKSFF
ncbi:ribonuclease E/G [Mesorhizobium sp. CAU 1732]|uniref:Rne/Rng family ribonuclease n=1 Tax=Mesorhizobium sp. CAU 1732 TaxID=3140358 RepID=UPI00326193CA